MARLDAEGYERRDRPHATSFTLEQGTEAPDRDFLERVLDWPGPGVHRILNLAARAGSGALAAGPFGRVATALGRPLAASVVGGEYVCSGTGVERDISDEDARLVRAIGELHPYQTFGLGYERVGPDAAAIGHYVFGYKRAREALADLPGRRRLIDEGSSIRYGAPYRESVFTIVDAVAEGRQLVLDVALINDRPQALFEAVVGRDLLFAICG